MTTARSKSLLDNTLEDAKKKLAKIMFAYERMPKVIRATVGLKRDNTEQIQFTNGSSISVGTTFRGDTPQFLYVSEYGKTASDSPDRAREIRTGSFNAVAKGGKLAVESTAHGTGGEFYDLIERAKKHQEAGLELTPLDFKLHFFAWWMDPKYSLPSNTVMIRQRIRKYARRYQPPPTLRVPSNNRDGPLTAESHDREQFAFSEPNDRKRLVRAWRR